MYDRTVMELFVSYCIRPPDFNTTHIRQSTSRNF